MTVNGGGDIGGRGGDDDDDDGGGGDPCWSVAYAVRVSACVRARARLVGGSRCCIQDEVRLETFVDSSGGKGESLHVSSNAAGRAETVAVCSSETSVITRVEERGCMLRAPCICRYPARKKYSDRGGVREGR